MITDEERREVARRLREIRPCKSGHIKWWEIAKALGLKQPAGWFGWEKFEPDSANRLADLIEPSEPKVKCVAEVKVDGEMRHSTKEEQNAYNAMLEKMSVEMHPVDRDALLELADEMEAWALTCDHYDRRVAPIEVSKYARRIRKALGEES